jgi:hypothetical protein
MLIRRLALVGATLLLLSSVAFAKPKVVLLAFSGDPKEEARRAVVSALADDVRFARRKDVRSALDKLELDPMDLSEKDLRSLAAELEADAVIQATLSKKEPNRLLRFKLFVRGKKVVGFKIEFGSIKSANFKEKLRDKIVEKLSEESDRPKPTGDDKASPGDDDGEVLTPLAGKAKRGDDPAADKAAKKGGDEDARESGEGDEPAKGDKEKKRAADSDAKPNADQASAPTVRPANRSALRLDVGASVHRRSLSFSTRSFPEAPKNYSNSIVPGVRIEAQAYPLAFGSPNSIVGGLGLGGLFDQTLLLKVTPEVQPGTKLPVTERRFAIGPRFRYVFGAASTSPSVTAAINYAKRSFVVNRAKLESGNTLDLPDVDYSGGDIGVEARIPIGGRIAVLAGGTFVLLTTAGPIEKPDQYGEARVIAAQGMAGLDVALTSRFAVRLTAEFAQYGFTFKGNGAQSNARDGDPSTPDVGGAADRYLSGAATFAVHY